MIFAKSFYVDTTKGVDLIPIGHEIRGLLKESKGEKGWVNVVVPRPGGGIVTLEAGEKERLPVTKEQARLLPKSLMIPFDKGRLAFDPWQEVLVVDYDELGRRREILIQVWGEDPKPAGPPMGMPL